jgi:hypothetical protein
LKNTILLGILLICSCSDRDRPIDQIIGLTPINDAINLIGRTWLYGRKYNLPGIIEHSPTSQAYSYMACDRDTSIQGKKYFVINEEYLAQGEMDTYMTNATYFVHIGNDSVIILETDTTSSTYSEVSLYKKTATWKVFKTTDNIRDKYTALLLPFSDTSSWYLRETATNNMNIKKRYLGKENVSAPAGKYECHKIAWEWSETFTDANKLSKTDWVSTYGLIQSEFDAGLSTLVNSWGDSLVLIGFLETTKLLSYSNMIPANVGPILSPDLIDTLKKIVRDSWKIATYKSWLDRHIVINNVTNIDELNNADVNNVTYLLQSIWGDSLTDLSSILSEFSKPFPTDSADFYDYLAFNQMVVWEYDMMPGWIDCDLNIGSGETSRSTPPFRFGNSVIRTRLMKTLYK